MPEDADEGAPMGWYLLGPMAALCVCCAPTRDEALVRVDGTLRAWPLTAAELERTPDLVCTSCARALLDCAG